MISIYDLKPTFQRTLNPLLSLCVRFNVSPNQITLAAILLSLAGGAAAWYSSFCPSYLLLVPVILFIRMALNALDGMLARQFGKSTPLGEILNELGDVVSDALIYMPLIFLFSQSLFTILLICLFVLLGVMCEFTGVLAKAMIAERRYDGPMGKSDRAFAISLLCLALYFIPSLAHAAVDFLFIALNGLLIFSCINRANVILARTRQTR